MQPVTAFIEIFHFSHAFADTDYGANDAFFCNSIQQNWMPG